MKRLLISAALCGLLASSAWATETNTPPSPPSHTVTVTTVEHVENSHVDIPLGCNPLIGNWVNVAPMTCLMRGSGPNSVDVTHTVTVEVPCPPKSYETPEAPESPESPDA